MRGVRAKKINEARKSREFVTNCNYFIKIFGNMKIYPLLCAVVRAEKGISPESDRDKFFIYKF